MLFTPEPYQETMIAHLVDNEVAALFAGMSLGKTACVLSALDRLISDFEVRAALVVAPLRVANVVWPAEVEKWDNFNWMITANLRTPEGRQMFKEHSAHIYLINYEQLPNLEKLIGPSCPFDVVVWDELDNAKSPTSKRINGIRRKLRKVCTHHWGMTGTPTPNNYLDLFAQYRLLDGGERLGKSYTHFRETYFRTTDFNGYRWEIRNGAKERIFERVKDITLSMRTSDFLDLPDMVMHDIDVSLPKGCRKRYDELERELIVALESGENIIAANAAVLVGKLLQFTSGAVYTEDGYELVHDEKVKALKDLLKSTGNTLVVYNFRHELDRIKKALPEAVVFADAKTPSEQVKLCDRWNAGKIKCLLVHPQSMSHGLNLQGGGSDVVWMSLNYSRGKYDQLNARLCRRGQDKQTNVYRIMAKETIDPAVASVLQDKGDRQEDLLKALKRVNL